MLPTKDEPRWLQDQAVFEKAGFDPLFSQGDCAKEKANVEALISQGIKVLIICPQDATAAAAAAEEAKAAGVKVISYDRLIRDTDAVDYYVTFDSMAVGAAWSQYLIRAGRRHQGQPAVSVCRRGLRQQRLHLLRRRLGEDPAQDRRRHVRDQELERSRGPQGQAHADA